MKAAVLPFGALPGRRSGARAGDALDRRGDGERARLRHRVREGRARGGAAAAGTAATRSSRCGTPTRSSRPRSRRRCRSSASTCSRPPARRARVAAAGLVGAGGREGRGDRRADPARALRPGRQHARGPATPARDGYLIREAALAARVPCITTIPGAAAAVNAIANARAEIALSLQERHEARVERLASSRTSRSARTRCCASRAAGSIPASRASSSCSRRPAGCCRGR